MCRSEDPESMLLCRAQTAPQQLLHGSLPHREPGLRLIFETAAALVDVVRLGPEHLADGVIVYTRQKLGKRSAPDAACPLSDELLAHLATMSTKTFLTHNGKPRSGAGLGNRVRAVAKDLGFEGSAHGLRKARANVLLSSGTDLSAVATGLGQS